LENDLEAFGVPTKLPPPDTRALAFIRALSKLDLVNAGVLDIYNTGGGLPHNNMQPTLFIGNTFIYSGVKNESSEFNTPCSNTYVIPPCLD
jgi:hypothetical protein